MARFSRVVRSDKSITDIATHSVSDNLIKKTRWNCGYILKHGLKVINQLAILPHTVLVAIC